MSATPITTRLPTRVPAPTIPSAELAVVIPMYREARRIEPTLQDVIAHLRRGDLPAEVVLVDDGSTDDTADAVGPWLSRRARGPLLRVSLVRHERNRGKGAAVRTGLAATTARWRLVMDADNATRISQLEHLWPVARSGAVLVTGSRLVPGARVESGPYRAVMRRVFSKAVSVLSLTDVRDTQCGFKLYRGDFADTVCDQAVEDGFAFDLEHLALAEHFAGPGGVVEVPVEWSDQPGSTVRPLRDGAGMLLRALRLRVRLGARGH